MERHVYSTDAPDGWSRREFLTALGGYSLAAVSGLATNDAIAGQLPSLEQQISQRIAELRRTGSITSDERTTWSVYDFRLGKKLVSINENVPRQSASMIKPFVAQAYFLQHGASQRRFPYDAKIKRLMERMLRDSSNSATNELIDRIGHGYSKRRPRVVERLLKQHAGGIFRQTSIVEYIPRSGRSYRNKASARDYSRFLFALWNSRLPFAGEIKHYMGMPNNDRIRSGVPIISPLAQVYDKTGSTAHLCGNMGSVAAPGHDGVVYPYTFIGVIEKSSRAKPYVRWLTARSNVIREVSAMVYVDMKRRYPIG